MYSDPVSDEPSIESKPSVVWKSGSVSVLHLLQRYDCYCECSQADNWHTIERTKRPVYPRGYMVHGTCRLLPHDEPFFSITNTHSANWDPWFMETFCHRKGNHLPASDSFERSYQDANRARLQTLFLVGTGASRSNNGFGNVGVAVAGVMGHSLAREGGPGAPAAASRVLTRGSAALSERSAAALSAAATVGAVVWLLAAAGRTVPASHGTRLCRQDNGDICAQVPHTLHHQYILFPFSLRDAALILLNTSDVLLCGAT